jgi:hypothetical protein
VHRQATELDIARRVRIPRLGKFYAGDCHGSENIDPDDSGGESGSYTWSTTGNDSPRLHPRLNAPVRYGRSVTNRRLKVAQSDQDKNAPVDTAELRRLAAQTARLAAVVTETATKQPSISQRS